MGNAFRTVQFKIFINRFKRFITGSFLELFNSFCKVIVYGVSMLLINTEFTLYVFIMLPIYFLTSYFYFKKQSKDFSALEEKEGQMTNVLQENLTGIRVVKAFANEGVEQEKFEKDNKEFFSTVYPHFKLLKG